MLVELEGDCQQKRSQDAGLNTPRKTTAKKHFLVKIACQKTLSLLILANKLHQLIVAEMFSRSGSHV